MNPCCRMNKDGSLVVWVNMDEHLRVVSSRADGDIAEAFRFLSVKLKKVSPPGAQMCSGSRF